MPLKHFTLPASETRLVQHKGILYKIRLDYGTQRGISTSLFLPCPKTMMQQEVESVLRAVLAINCKDKLPLHIKTEHFTMFCSVKPWGVIKRLSFQQYGQKMTVFPQVITILVQPDLRDSTEGGSEPITKQNVQTCKASQSMNNVRVRRDSLTHDFSTQMIRQKSPLIHGANTCSQQPTTDCQSFGTSTKVCTMSPNEDTTEYSQHFVDSDKLTSLTSNNRKRHHHVTSKLPSAEVISRKKSAMLDSRNKTPGITNYSMDDSGLKKGNNPYQKPKMWAHRSMTGRAFVNLGPKLTLEELQRKGQTNQYSTSHKQYINERKIYECASGDGGVHYGRVKSAANSCNLQKQVNRKRDERSDSVSSQSMNHETLTYQQDKTLIQQEELAEELKLQQLAKPREFSNDQNSERHSSFLRAVSYMLSPVTKLFKN